MQKQQVSNGRVVANVKNAASDIHESETIQKISNRYNSIEFQIYDGTNSRTQTKTELENQCNILRGKAKAGYQFPTHTGINTLIAALDAGRSVHFGITKASTRANDFEYADGCFTDYDGKLKSGDIDPAAATTEELLALPSIKKYCAFYQASYSGEPNLHFHGVFDRRVIDKDELTALIQYWNHLLNEELKLLGDKKPFDPSTKSNSSHLCYAGKTDCKFIDRVPGLDTDFGDLIPVDVWLKAATEIGLVKNGNLGKAALPKNVKSVKTQNEESHLEYIQRIVVDGVLEGDFTALFDLYEHRWHRPEPWDGGIKVKGSNPFSDTNKSGTSFYITYYPDKLPLLPPVWTSANGTGDTEHRKNGGEIVEYFYYMDKRLEGKYQHGGLKANTRKIVSDICNRFGVEPYSWKNSSSEDDDNRTKRQILIDKIYAVHPPEKIRFNEMTLNPEINDNFVNADTIAVDLDRFHSVVMTKDTANEIILALSMDYKYHPVRDYLNNVATRFPQEQTQGIIDNLSTRYFGTTEPIYDIYVKRALVAMVARVFQPGCAHKTMVVLQGAQNVGKSRFLEALIGKDWFNDNLDITKGHDKDVALKTQRFWGHEIGEIDQFFRKSDRASIKSFISSPSDNFRIPFGRSVEPHPRTSVFWGSTNETDILSDPTGSVRFLCIPIAVSKIDVAAVERERDLLWAAAVHAYHSGTQWWLTDDEDKIRESSNEQFTTTDPWESIFLPWISDYSAVPVLVALSILGIEKKDQNKINQNRVTDILKRHGWVNDSKNTKILGTPYRLWHNPDKSKKLKDPKEAVSIALNNLSIPTSTL